jgi:hypothetical protein
MDFGTRESVKIFIIISSLFVEDFKASDGLHYVEWLGPGRYMYSGFALQLLVMFSKKTTCYFLGTDVKVGENIFQSMSWFEASCKTSGNLIILTLFCIRWIHMVSTIH